MGLRILPTVRSNPALPEDNTGLWAAGVVIASVVAFVGYKIHNQTNEGSPISDKVREQVKASAFSPDPGVTCYRYYSQLSCVKN